LLSNGILTKIKITRNKPQLDLEKLLKLINALLISPREKRMTHMDLTHQVMELVLISTMRMIFLNTFSKTLDLIVKMIKTFLVHSSVEKEKADFHQCLGMMIFSQKVLEEMDLEADLVQVHLAVHQWED
jgi:hypothetical protein